METAVLIQLVTAISTSLIALCGVFSAIYWGYIPRKQKAKVEKLQKELLDCYCDIYNLLQIEKDYMDEEGLTKQKVREYRRLSDRSQPGNVDKRIEELKSLTKHN
jgi:hypothetical protein